jgi:hypothetical protein
MSRSTSSKGAFGLETCTLRIFAIVPPDRSILAHPPRRMTKGCTKGGVVNESFPRNPAGDVPSRGEWNIPRLSSSKLLIAP